MTAETAAILARVDLLLELGDVARARAEITTALTAPSAHRRAYNRGQKADARARVREVRADNADNADNADPPSSPSPSPSPPEVPPSLPPHPPLCPPLPPALPPDPLFPAIGPSVLPRADAREGPPASPAPRAAVPPCGWPRFVDAVLEQVGTVTGRRYATGPGRSKAHADAIRARSLELYEAARRRDDLDAAGETPWDVVWRQLVLVVHFKRAQCDEPRNGDPRQTRYQLDWVRPSTLFRASHVPEYLAEARERYDDVGDDVWITEGEPLAPWRTP